MKEHTSILFVIILLSMALTGCINPSPTDIKDHHIISIACWDINPVDSDLYTTYADQISNHDICILQGVRDLSGNRIQRISRYLDTYEYHVHTSTIDETIYIFYNENITLLDTVDYLPDYQDKMIRPPIKLTFQVDNWTFDIFTTSLEAENVPLELYYLASIFVNAENDAIVMGDFHMDGIYYNEDEIYTVIGWDWLIDNNVDTTTTSDDNTYDRIIINNGCTDNLVSTDISDVVISDHYLISATFDATVV